MAGIFDVIASPFKFIGDLAGSAFGAMTDTASEGSREYSSNEADIARKFTTSERLASQAFNADQAAINRSFQRNMYEKQLQDNLLQWQRENAEYDRRLKSQRDYESPSALRARYEQAGINPALAMADGSSMGNIGSVGNMSMPSSPAGDSASSSSHPGSVASTPVVGGSMSDLLSPISALQSIAQMHGIIIDNKYREAEHLKQLDNLASQTEHNKALSSFFKQQTDEMMKTFKDRYRKGSSEADLAAELVKESVAKQELLAADKAGRDLANKMAEIDLKNLPEKTKLQFADLMASAFQKNKSALESVAHAGFLDKAGSHMMIESMKNIAESAHLDAMTELLNKEQPLILKSMEKHIRQMGSDYWNPFRYTGMVFGGVGKEALRYIAK